MKLGNHQAGVAAADTAIQSEPKEPRLWHAAARVYAQAAAQLQGQPGQDAARTMTGSRYQARAVVLLGKALHLVPRDQRQGYWQETVLKDAALYPIRAKFGELTVRFGLQDR